MTSDVPTDADRLRRYVKRPEVTVQAIRLSLDFDGFSYRKWGDVQRCKPGDWLVLNNGELYTVDADSFAATYEALPDHEGRFRKTASVWARRARQDGQIETREGTTHYHAGDFIVYNDSDGRDGYAVPADEFLGQYREAPDS